MTFPGGLLYDPSQSAVSQLLGILAQHPAAGQPGAPPPAPVAPMAPVNANPTPVGSINAGMEAPQQPQSLLGKVHDFVQDRIGGNVPSEYAQSGLLSNSEIRSAKPGIMQILAHSDSYRHNLDRMLQMKQIAGQIGEAHRVQSVRADMAKMFAPKEGEDHAGTMGRLEKMFAYAVQNGDAETASNLKGVIAEMAIPGKPAAPVMGSPEWMDAEKYLASLKTPAQRNIDPLSNEGIAAQLKLKTAQATLKGGTNLPAPLAAKVGQAGEMIKKASDLLPMMDALDVTNPESAAQDIAAHGIGVGHMRIPGTQGIGSSLLNRTEPYSKYQAALSPFILAAAHALSGARINQDQVEQIRHSIEFKPGDTAPVKAQKRKNMMDLVNSIGGSLPADAIASQEDQMDPNQVAMLKGYGYRGAARGETPAASRTPSYEDWKKAKGHK